MLDHFHVSKGAVSAVDLVSQYIAHLRFAQGFPDHPHRGQATVTYMLEGCVYFSLFQNGA